MNLPTLSTHVSPNFEPSAEGVFLKILYDVGFRLTTIDPTISAFIQFAASQKEWVLDVSCGFGVATIPIIMSGGYVIANDLEEQHVESIKRKIPTQHIEHLRTLKAVFPDEVQLEENSVVAILISRFFRFFSDSKIEQSLALSFQWLKPGGKIFIECEAIRARDLIIRVLSQSGFLVVSDTFSSRERGIIAQKP